MRNAVTAYAAAALVMLGLDLTWLHLTQEPLYHRALGAMLAQKPNLSAAAAFYVLYVLGVVIFAVWPALESGNWRSALVRGALFGFFAYATYDLTNLATLKLWSLRVTVIDMAWGTFVTAATAGAAAAIALALEK